LCLNDRTTTTLHPINGLLQDNLGKLAPERYTILDFNEARDGAMTMASAGPYANHLTLLQIDNRACTSPVTFYRPDALPAAHPTASKH